jgi:hypothetical protein
MMRSSYDTVISLDSSNADVMIEQFQKDGAISRKHISPATLNSCLMASRYENETHAIGLFPENCIAVTTHTKHTQYFIRFPELYADISYYGTEYPRFPIPRLVFGFTYMLEESKVSGTRLCVVKDEKLTPDTPLYSYPFSNVSNDDGSICLGNNTLPIYKNPVRLSTLPGYVLRMPNNNDRYSNHNNRLGLEYRDLLEYMREKPPSSYYTDVLIPSGRTLKHFLDWRS